MIQSKILHWTIYKVTNPVSEVYVGRTQNYKNRLLQYNHVGTTSQQRLLYDSFIKYGKENHSFDIIDEFDGSSSYANGKEKFWIRTCMSNINKWSEWKGMNMTDGGNGTSGLKHTPECIEKMANRFRGKKLSKEHRLKLSEASTGNHKLGTKQTEETKIKIGNAIKGMKRTEETKLRMSESSKKQWAKRKSIFNN